MSAERAFNALLGLSVLGWAVAGMAAAPEAERLSAVRCLVAGLNAAVGVALVVRSRLVRPGRVAALAASVPALAIAGVAFAATPPADTWPRHAEVLFAVGGLVAIASIASLGRSFAIFPAVRDVVHRGPFAVVRHPTYAGETLMIAACALAAASWLGVAVVTLTLPLVVLRILAEEKLLATVPAYRSYRARVRWRLLPGVW